MRWDQNFLVHSSNDTYLLNHYFNISEHTYALRKHVYFEITRNLNLLFFRYNQIFFLFIFFSNEIKSSCLVFSFYILHDVAMMLPEKKAHNHPSTIFNSCWFVEFWESPFLVINLGSQCCILCQHLFERVTNGFIRKQSLFGVLKLPLSPSYLLLKMISIIGDNKTVK